MDKLLVKIENDSDFMNIVGDILENKMVQQMKNYRQHYETTCFEHCLIASYFAICIVKSIILITYLVQRLQWFMIFFI